MNDTVDEVRSIVEHIRSGQGDPDLTVLLTHIEYARSTGEVKLLFKGQPVTNDQVFRIGLQELYFINSEAVLDQTNDELTRAGGLNIISEDAFGVLRKYFEGHKGLGGRVDRRIIIK